MSFYITGYHFFFHIRQWQIKAAVQKKLRQDINSQNTELFVFSLTKQEGVAGPEWEGDDEFRLNGEMFDVIEKRIENGKMFVRCISDKKETALLKDYERINKEGNSKRKSESLLKLMVSSFLPEPNFAIRNKDIPSPVNIPFQSEIIPSYRQDVLTPPPQLS